jgi:hypothetical protein
VRNPFEYGGVVSGDAFCNRKQELADLRRAMENAEKLFVFSERRYGKTSLVRATLDKLPRKNSCQRMSIYGRQTVRPPSSLPRHCGINELIGGKSAGDGKEIRIAPGERCHRPRQRVFSNHRSILPAVDSVRSEGLSIFMAIADSLPKLARFWHVFGPRAPLTREEGAVREGLCSLLVLQ